MRILVVDDNKDLALSTAALLRLQGHDVSVAHNGEVALSVTERFKPAAVFLDIGLPGIDGYEVARCIRQMPSGQEIRIIALTAQDPCEGRDAARNVRMDGHLVKPAEADALIDALAEA